jgi:hypothetical protein
MGKGPRDKETSLGGEAQFYCAVLLARLNRLRKKADLVNEHSQGLKARHVFAIVTARVNSCPVTKPVRFELFRKP